MAVEKAIGSSSLVEVIDRILDKGIVIDAWVRVSLVGIELLAIEARVVVASVETYLKYAEAVAYGHSGRSLEAPTAEVSEAGQPGHGGLAGPRQYPARLPASRIVQAASSGVNGGRSADGDTGRDARPRQ